MRILNIQEDLENNNKSILEKKNQGKEVRVQ